MATFGPKGVIPLVSYEANSPFWGRVSFASFEETWVPR